jgi:class 3 adenylate cyclase
MQFERAIYMRERIDYFNALHHRRDIVLKIGIHRGASIAVTLNERLDYFGQTVNIAARVQGQARGDEICLTGDVHNETGVTELVSSYSIVAEAIPLKGLDYDVALFRLKSSRNQVETLRSRRSLAPYRRGGHI